MTLDAVVPPEFFYAQGMVIEESESIAKICFNCEIASLPTLDDFLQLAGVANADFEITNLRTVGL